MAEQKQKKEQKEEEKKEEGVWSMQELPTQSKTFIVNKPTKTVYSVEEVLVVLLNKIDKLERVMCP